MSFSDDDETLMATAEKERFEDLIILRKTKRMSGFDYKAIRSKYIAIPNQVVQAGNHFIHEFQQGREVNVPTDIGFLHHYRATCVDVGPGSLRTCLKGPTEVDRTMYKYKAQLLKNMNSVFLKLSRKCKLF